MIEKSLNIIYNKKYLVIIPEIIKELQEAFEHTLGNTIILKQGMTETEIITNFINQNNYRKLIFVDYAVEYNTIINKLKENHEIKFIFTKSLGSLSDNYSFTILKNIFELYNNKVTSSIGFLDKCMYDTVSMLYKGMFYLKLDIPSNYNSMSEPKESLTIGLINNGEDPKYSFYNELSAIKLNGKYVAKIDKASKATKKFLKTFRVPYVIEKNKDDLLTNNIVNLYINFTANDYTLFLKSMDAGIPCIIGNNEILDSESKLNDYLMINSDDNIDEIATKITETIKNKKKIQNEYKEFRKKYIKESKHLAEQFLSSPNDSQPSVKYEKLISIIVPVYNVEKYLDSSLKSIIASIIPNCEILIINDGSPDNSEKIILEYQKKYPSLIRYIKQKNHGLGNVRNVGLKEAKGKYIASIDSDDTINKKFFREALPYLEKNVDMVIYDWLTVNSEGKFETAALDYIFNDINRYEGLLYTTIMPSTCNKIVKKELYDKLNLKFVEDKFEDLSANPFVMLEAETIKYINKPYYEYYIRSNSIMRTKPGLSMIDVIKEVNNRIEKYKDIINVDIDKFKYYTFAWRIEEYIFNQLYTIDEMEIEAYIKYIYSNLKTVIMEIFNNELYIKRIEELKTEELKKYIIKRNKEFEKGNLKKYIIDARKNKKYYKLTPPIMYYGD